MGRLLTLHMVKLSWTCGTTYGPQILPSLGVISEHESRSKPRELLDAHDSIGFKLIKLPTLPYKWPIQFDLLVPHGLLSTTWGWLLSTELEVETELSDVTSKATSITKTARGLPWFFTQRMLATRRLPSLMHFLALLSRIWLARQLKTGSFFYSYFTDPDHLYHSNSLWVILYSCLFLFLFYLVSTFSFCNSNVFIFLLLPVNIIGIHLTMKSFLLL